MQSFSTYFREYLTTFWRLNDELLILDCYSCSTLWKSCICCDEAEPSIDFCIIFLHNVYLSKAILIFFHCFITIFKFLHTFYVHTFYPRQCRQRQLNVIRLIYIQYSSYIWRLVLLRTLPSIINF